MTVLHLADEGEAADLAAFLSRLIHYDRGAAVRLQSAGTALAVFGRPPSFEVLAIRAVRLAKPYENGLDVTLDVTVSAGELLESVDESAGTAVVPAPVTGPPWAGVLPPRGGWRPEPGLPDPDALRAMVAAGVTEFRSRTGELVDERRTRAELDRIGREIWSRAVGTTGLPVRAVHAAQSLGFLRPTQSAGAPVLISSGAWLRLRTPYGSIAVRRAGLGALDVSVR
ncbi:FAD-binding PCMH-type domain-containing protein OS=Streptomyces alboniger OX=132473 GN=CP975_12180 PE=4 SV=1 [Streptomyces alboniger]